jgi:hypothetical protein
LLSCDPSLTNEQIRTLFETTAVDLGTPGRDNSYGHGRLDVLAALRAAGCSPRVSFQYPAKFVCGAQTEDDNLRLAQGFYATAINVHNPNDSDAELGWSLAFTFPRIAPWQGKFIQLQDGIILEPDRALEIDCEDLKHWLFPVGQRESYAKGFVIIESSASLDVTGVYTLAGLERSGVGGTGYSLTNAVSIDVEQIPERQQGGSEPADQPTAERPDLIPVPDSQGSFCRLKDRQLVVVVTNQGTSPAGASMLEVDFFSYGTVTRTVPALDPGHTHEEAVEIPSKCYDSDCEFTISVDSMLQVEESNEANNVAHGSCIG